MHVKSLFKNLRFSISCVAILSIASCSVARQPNALGCTYEGIYNKQVLKRGGYIFQLNERDSRVLLVSKSKVQSFEAVFSPDEIIFSNKWIAGYYRDSIREDYFSVNRKNLDFLMQVRQDGLVYANLTGKCKKIHIDQESNQV
jgi:hypothetical protein